jgi:TolA-binding protein
MAALDRLVQTENSYPMSNVLEGIIVWEAKAQLALNNAVVAEATLRRGLMRFPTPTNGGEWHYWLGRTIEAQMRLPEALAEFKMVVSMFRASALADNAFDHLVRIEVDLGTCPAANTDYAAFKSAFPTSPLLTGCCAYKMAKCAGACP